MPKFLVDYLRDQGVDKKVRFLTLSLALPILTLLLIVLALFIPPLRLTRKQTTFNKGCYLQ